jgi:adenylylsulfate kinase
MSNVIWITGLSAAGKTTLATAVTRRLREEGTPVVMLDGDELREALAVTDTHTRDSRLVLAHKYSRLARMIARQGVTVVVGTVALFKEIHAWNRENLPGYFEVYLRVSHDELRRRDPKGIYKRFDAGKITDVAAEGQQDQRGHERQRDAVTAPRAHAVRPSSASSGARRASQP